MATIVLRRLEPRGALTRIVARERRTWPIPSPPPNDRLPIGCMTGVVTSDAMQKTVTVAVTRMRVVPKYRVQRKYTRKFLAHDEDEQCALGDFVRISPCRPLSKRKHFQVQSILKKAAQI